MKTLVELYDDCPIENVLAADTFRPERTVYLCPSEIAQDKEKQKRLQEYFRHRGMDMETVFLDTSLFHTDKVIRQLQRVVERIRTAPLILPEAAMQLSLQPDTSVGRRISRSLRTAGKSRSSLPSTMPTLPIIFLFPCSTPCRTSSSWHMVM